MEQRLTELWYRERAPPSLLTPLAWLYGALMRARRRAYVSGWLRTERAGKPVVVVGNLTLGGTGKTPLTIWLARRLIAIVARDRVAGARALVAGGADVILADDGLQHLRLGRDCEIVVIDGARGLGNGRVLPAGPLREPLGRLPQPDAVVVNGAPEHGSLGAASRTSPALEMRLVAQEALRLDGQEPPRALHGFCGQRVHAVAGIGNPARFFRELRAHGIEVIEHPFADHHRFAAPELAFADRLPVLMTEKDAVKCVAFADPRLWYVPVAAQFGAREAHELLARVLAKVRPTGAGGQT